MSREYIAALKILKAEWDSFLELHAFLHEGSDEDLEMGAGDLKKKITQTYDNYNKKKIGRFTKKHMIAEVTELQETPPRQYLETILLDFDVTPYHDVPKEIERLILKLETSVLDADVSEVEIPPEYQSPPVSLNFAAACFGSNMSPRKLRRLIDKNLYHVIEPKRQNLIFDLRELPKEVAGKIQK